MANQEDLDVSTIPVPASIEQAASSIQPRLLTSDELDAARHAWRYFQSQTDPGTGLAYSVKGYPATTMWELGGQLLATISAWRLGLIAKAEARQLLSTVLSSLAAMPLVEGHLPNQSYNARTLAMTDYSNRPRASGTGVSVLDVMRVVTGLQAVAKHLPDLGLSVQAIINAWDLGSLVKDGSLVGWHKGPNGKLVQMQEGRLGYEQYAARAALSLGLDAFAAVSVAGKATAINVGGQILPQDKRTKASHGRASILTSEPFLMEVLEYGWRANTRAMALAVYAAQQNEGKRAGELTVVSEDHLDQAPYFAYTGVLVDDQPFEAVSASRARVQNPPRFSTKAAFGWHALVGDDYSQALCQQAQKLREPEGFYAGIYKTRSTINKSQSLNTNALILEALHFQAFGEPLNGFSQTIASSRDTAG